MSSFIRHLNPLDIPWPVCLCLAVLFYLLSKPFNRKEDEQPWRTSWPVLGGISRALMLTFSIIGVIGMVRNWR